MASGSQRSGSGYGGTTIRYDWNSSTNVAGNYSTVNVSLYLELRNSTYFVATESGNINVAGNVSGYSRGNTSRGPNGTYLLHSYSVNIGHNNDGTQSAYIGGSFNSGFSSVGSFSVGQNWALDTIPRYPGITSFTRTNISDVGFTTNVSVDSTCDWLQYSLDGGAWTSVGSGTFTSRSFNLDNLTSGVNHTIRVRVRRQSSGLWTESSTATVATLPQNNFMDFFDTV